MNPGGPVVISCRLGAMTYSAQGLGSSSSLLELRMTFGSLIEELELVIFGLESRQYWMGRRRTSTKVYLAESIAASSLREVAEVRTYADADHQILEPTLVFPLGWSLEEAKQSLGTTRLNLR